MAPRKRTINGETFKGKAIIIAGDTTSPSFDDQLRTTKDTDFSRRENQPLVSNSRNNAKTSLFRCFTR